MDIDGCKTNSVNARAPSTDSLNIRTDEKMPAKGEISEQESNGDVEGLWNHQVGFFFLIFILVPIWDRWSIFLIWTSYFENIFSYGFLN